MNKYSQEEIAVFKSRLLEIKTQEEKQLQELSNEFAQLTENGKDENSLDTTSYSMQLERIINSMNRLKKHLLHVNNALLRIENNVYGNCAETGIMIPKERLMAVPTTTLSIEGKKIRESKPK